MQIVINIPKEKYDMVRNKTYCGIYDAVIYKAIAKGTPLPKGHGRLKDIDDLDTTTIETEEYNGDEALEVVLREDIDDAPTIIPADTESED